MWTVSYYPSDYPWMLVCCQKDATLKRNLAAKMEAPSYCVRLWVWEMPNHE